MSAPTLLPESIYTDEELYTRFKIAILPAIQRDYKYGGTNNQRDWDEIMRVADEKANQLLTQHRKRYINK